MRTKTEHKRAEILRAAAEVFGRAGFEGTSMAEIQVHAGCSKPTLYIYFDSKEALFSAVVFDATEAEFQAMIVMLDPAAGDIEEALVGFGRKLLALLYSPQVQAMRRLVVCAAGRGELGRKCHALGPARGEAAIARFLEAAMTEGKLRKADPRRAGLQLKALLEAEWIEAFMFQSMEALDDKMIEDSVRHAIETFMLAYRT